MGTPLKVTYGMPSQGDSASAAFRQKLALGAYLARLLVYKVAISALLLTLNF